MTKIIIKEENQEVRLDILVASASPAYSRAKIKSLIEDGQILVNGSICTQASRKSRIGDCIEFALPEPEPCGLPKPQSGLKYRIVFEDEHIIVVDKPAGLVVHPGAGHPDGTLVNALIDLDPRIAEIGEPDRPGIVHRLDADTSGLLLVARSQESYQKLTQMFAGHEISRQYRALCHGPKLSDQGTWDTPYGRHPTQRIKYSSRFDAPKRAITHYHVEERTERGYALVTCLLETGRTHQVRVHLSDHHAPILGDKLYAPAPIANTKIISRLALHAQRLTFNHPITGENCEFFSLFPEDFRAALKKLGLKEPAL